ncbi:hypothetical protein ACH5RR_037207 [Cinchona calisaya]|uniref:Uncharacterized protein n=1 Tax=Cinchona calisaya TaxID=153742 RepID=A0ABD2YAY9_9GENT
MGREIHPKSTTIPKNGQCREYVDQHCGSGGGTDGGDDSGEKVEELDKAMEVDEMRVLRERDWDRIRQRTWLMRVESFSWWLPLGMQGCSLGLFGFILM